MSERFAELSCSFGDSRATKSDNEWAVGNSRKYNMQRKCKNVMFNRGTEFFA